MRAFRRHCITLNNVRPCEPTYALRSTHKSLKTGSHVPIYATTTCIASAFRLTTVPNRSFGSSRAIWYEVGGAMAVTQPPWSRPPDLNADIQKELPNIQIYNSLTKSKTPFTPIDRSGKRITWYACGPTVYDDSHLGHARTYVSTDIIRRILQDYFQFDVKFVMNITDVDDKIILAARQQHLLAKWAFEHRSDNETIRSTILDATRAYIGKNLSLLDNSLAIDDIDTAIEKVYGHVLRGRSLADDGTAPGDREAKVKMHIKTTLAALQALRVPSVAVEDRLALSSGVLLPYIDAKQSTTVDGKDHTIFTKLTRKYEERFFDDMRALNVRYPDVVTRVTEYGPEIIDFVDKIQKNGFAYEHEGSVYYDVGAWETAGGNYARLEPWNRNDQELQADGEGALSTKKTAFKHSGADFALWKASKPGEPLWSSPWGEGRPGWHIECSAMASKVLGQTIDIHSGGIDLAFPHHDNELAQSEAYWCDSHDVAHGSQWINYFIHMGHLSIQGSKMSKSLKNFTTIREALAKGEWTPRGLRILFLQGSWRDGLEITPAIVKAALAWEEKVDNFFLKVRDVQRRSSKSDINRAAGQLSINGTSSDLINKLDTAKEKFHAALCDSFDTPTALRIISELLTAVNSEKQVAATTLLSIGRWVYDMVDMFGLDAQRDSDLLGWSGLELTSKALSVIEPLASARDEIRSQATKGSVEGSQIKALPPLKTDALEDPYVVAYHQFGHTVDNLRKNNATANEWLAACDLLRDKILWDLGVYLEDRDGQPALVRPLSTTLRQERKDREAFAASKAAAKQKAKSDAEAAEKEKLLKGQLSPLEMFRTSEYSAWDADGLPLKDADGAELAKSRSKKLKKDWDRQKKLHEAYLASVNGGVIS